MKLEEGPGLDPDDFLKNMGTQMVIYRRPAHRVVSPNHLIQVGLTLSTNICTYQHSEELQARQNSEEISVCFWTSFSLSAKWLISGQYYQNKVSQK